MDRVSEIGKVEGASRSGEVGRLGQGAAANRATGGPKVAILDGFQGHRIKDTRDVAHGEMVEQVFLDSSGLSPEDVQRFAVGEKGGPAYQPGQLDAFIEGGLITNLNETSTALQEVLQDPDIQIITQSMGSSEVFMAEMIATMSANPEFRRSFCADLGLPADSPDDVFLQAVVNRVDKIHEESGKVKAARERYDSLTSQVDDRGIVYTVAAGNHGNFARQLAELGVQIDQDFFRNDFDNGHTTVVGASNGDGTPWERTTPNAGAEVAMDGSDITATVDGETVTKSGTSFSTPQVAAVAAQILQINPSLTDEQVEEILKASAQGAPGTDSTLGAGEVDLAKARFLALLGG